MARGEPLGANLDRSEMIDHIAESDWTSPAVVVVRIGTDMTESWLVELDDGAPEMQDIWAILKDLEQDLDDEDRINDIGLVVEVVKITTTQLMAIELAGRG